MQKMLVDILPASVNYLPKKGIKCIACGEPIWGTLEEAARENTCCFQEGLLTSPYS